MKKSAQNHKKGEFPMERVQTVDALEMLCEKMVGEINSLPYIHTLSSPVKQGRGDEEQAVLLISDLQLGHKTPTTTMNIIKGRMDRLVERALKIVSLHRKVGAVPKLNVFLLGDICHNERIGKTIDLHELEGVLSEQMFKYAVPILVSALRQLEPHFPQGIDVYCVEGNHGSMGKFHARTTNIDQIVYRFVEAKLERYKRIRFHTEFELFYQKANIYKWRFFLMHGDKIPMHLTLPYYGVTTRMMRLMGAVGEFDYLCLGHFHIPSNLSWGNAEIFINGCFVTDDQWVLANIGMPSLAKQMLFFVHPKQGVFARYLVKLD